MKAEPTITSYVLYAIGERFAPGAFVDEVGTIMKFGDQRRRVLSAVVASTGRYVEFALGDVQQVPVECGLHHLVDEFTTDDDNLAADMAAAQEGHAFSDLYVGEGREPPEVGANR